MFLKKSIYLTKKIKLFINLLWQRSATIQVVNINSLQNKFDLLTYEIKDNIDILTITETKLNKSLPIRQFFINGTSSSFRFDRDRNSAGILLCMKEDIPSKLLPIKNIIEIFLWKKIYIEKMAN